MPVHGYPTTQRPEGVVGRLILERPEGVVGRLILVVLVRTYERSSVLEIRNIRVCIAHPPASGAPEGSLPWRGRVSS